MILLRGQQLGDDDLLAFSRRFGELDPPPNQERGRISPPGYPDIYVVSNVLDPRAIPSAPWGRARRRGTRHDLSRHPARCLQLYSLEIPESGGNTWFCGMQAAEMPCRPIFGVGSKAGASSTTAPTTPAATCAKA